jgi:LEA14-like dessication related protein
MKNHLLILCSTLLFSILMTSCRSVKDLEYKEVKNVKLDKAGFSSIIVKADVVYYNPNKFSVEVNQANVDIFLNDNFLGNSKQTVQTKIPRESIFILPLQIEIDNKNLLKNGLNALFNKEVTLKMKGSVRAGKAGIFKTFPIDYKTVQKNPLF